MKRAAICFIFFAVLFFAAILPVYARDIAMQPLAMPTAASNGFGGTHVAYTDNVFALLVNPAAIMRVQQRSFFALAPSLMNPEFTANSINYTRDAVNAIMDDDFEAMGNALGKMADELEKREGKIALGLELREFPLSFAWVANGFGFGLWNRTFVNVNIEGTWVSASIYEDVILPIGFAFKILELDRHAVDAGVSLKPFFRAMALEQESITALMDGSSDFVDRINVPLMLGFGADLGLLYRWDMGFSAGITFSDIYTRGSVMLNLNETYHENNSYYVPFSLNIGLAYDFRLGRVWDSAPSILESLGFTLAFDWRNLANVFRQDDYLNSRNAALDIGLGFQVLWLDIFRIRAGMSEMLPAFGLGFDLGPIEIDLAYYGREFGREPGQLSTAVVDLSIAVRPGAKERNWPWARRSIVGLIAGVEAVSANEPDF